MMRIGVRNLKTALAVFICMAISKILKLEYPFFVAIAAIISMENSLLNSFKAGKNRMLGTLIGAGFGLAFALISPENAVLCSIGIIAVIYCCNLLKWRKPVAFAGVVFMAVSLNARNPVLYSINRIFDTFIGIMVAVMVNYFIFPPDFLPKIRRIIPDLAFKTEQIIGELLRKKKISLTEYEREIVKVNELLELCCADNRVRPRKRKTETIVEMQGQVKDFNEILQHLRIICPMNAESDLDQLSVREIQNIGRWSGLPLPCQTVPEKEKETTIVYNYHVRKVLTLYRNLTGISTP